MTRGSTRWCDGIEPTTINVSCGGELHRITWRRGKLVLENHALTSELALAALGGDRCECLEVLRAWARVDLLLPFPTEMMALLQERLKSDRPANPELTGVEAPLEVPDSGGDLRALRAARASLIRRAIAGRGEEGTLRHILTTLPPEMALRTALAAVMRMERRWTELPSDDRVSLQLFLYRAIRAGVIQSMESWRRVDAAPLYFIDCQLALKGEEPSIEGRVDHQRAEVTVVVPLTWLVRVWSRGISVVDGCFILEASGEVDDVTVRAVRWQRLTPFASVAVTAPGRLIPTQEGSWMLRWE